jgi:hypothetical protein
MVSAVLPEEQQDAALEVLRQERIKLISLAPVRSSLEEYYVQKLGTADASKNVSSSTPKKEIGIGIGV